ncbi:hypothetical protein GOBAR_DD28181 [Gossypium barbadense]|nr:hypothetical protein GOBAR_DD28181 [Gossypium barbadense]
MATGQVLNPGDHIYTECLGGSYYHHGFVRMHGSKSTLNLPRQGQLLNSFVHGSHVDLIKPTFGFHPITTHLEVTLSLKRLTLMGHVDLRHICRQRPGDKPQHWKNPNHNKCSHSFPWTRQRRQSNGLYRYEYDVSLLSFTFKTSGSCTPWSCYDPNTVIKRAYDYLRDQNFGDYNFVFNNCEHFATKCKMGKARCNQALWGTGLPGALVYNVTRRLTKDILW